MFATATNRGDGRGKSRRESGDTGGKICALLKVVVH